MLDAQAQAQIQDFVHVLKKRKWMILMPCLFFVTLGSAFAAIVPKKYRVDTEIEVKPTRVQTDYQLRNPYESAAAREIPNATKHIKNNNRVRRVIEGDLENWPEYHRASKAVQRDIIESVVDDLEVDMDEKDKKAQVSSTFVRIIYRDPVQARAPLFLNQLREAWLEDVVAWDLTELKKERDAYFNQKAEAENALGGLQSLYFELRRELNLDPRALVERQDGRAGPDNDFIYAQLLTEHERRTEALQALESSRGQLEQLDELFDMEPEQVFEERRDDGVSYKKEIGTALAEIDEHLAVRDRITPQNSRYKEIERDIADLRKRILSLEALERGGGSIQVTVPNERKREFGRLREEKQTELAGYARVIARADDRIQEYQKDIAGRTKKYEDLHQLENQMRIAQEEFDVVARELARTERSVAILEEGSGRPYSIAKDAESDADAVEPNPWIIVALTALLGLAFGMFLALIVEYGSNSYRTVTELAGVMSVPVLGAIEPIVTHAELRKAQFRRAMVGFSTAILVGGIAWITYMYKFSPEKLPVEIQQALTTIELNLR